MVPSDTSGGGLTLLDSSSGLPSLLQTEEFYVEVLQGLGQGTFGPFVPPIRIGSGETNDVVVIEPTVSHSHCSIEHDTLGLRVSDSGSRNGTFVDEVRIERAYLSSGCTLRLGQSKLAIRITRRCPLDLSLEVSFGGLHGQGHAMRGLFAALQRAGKLDTPVLIEGEPGTGKGLAARGLHEQGSRSAGPFVMVSCGAESAGRVEQRLFGFAKGSVRAAHADMAGAIEQADGGTLFLDGIDQLDEVFQPRLTKALEAGVVCRIGESTERVVDVRVVASAHRGLRKLVNAGRFDAELYSFLAVFSLVIPSLRERLGDIPLLARLFLARVLGSTDVQLSSKSVRVLQSHRWPGNVRELRRVVESAAILGELADIERGDLEAGLRIALSHLQASTRQLAPTLDVSLHQAERQYLRRLLDRHGSDLKKAASEAGLSVRALSKRLRSQGLRLS